MSLHTKVKVRMPAGKFPIDRFPRPTVDDAADGAVGTPQSIVLREYGTNGTSRVLVESSLGRFLLNTAFPDDFPFVDRPMRKRDITEVVSELVVLYDKAVVADSLDKLKALGYEWSTRAGPDDLHLRRHDPARQGRVCSSSSKVKRPRSRASTTAASSPTTSGASRRSRSGPTPPTR